MKYITTALLLFILLQTNAQAPLVKQWDRRFGGNDDDELFAFLQTKDGGYMLAGTSASEISGDKTQNCWVLGIYDFWVIKTDSLGIKQWDKRFGGYSWDGLTSLQQTVDGGYILGGFSGGDSTGDKTQPAWNHSSDYWVVKVDSYGNKEWDKRFGGFDVDMLQSLQQCRDGGYILGGYSSSDSTGDKTQHRQGGLFDYDYWVVKIDSVGNKQWDKRYGGSGSDQLTSLLTTTDGGYILAGYSVSDSSGDKTQPAWGGGDFWIVKIDMSGIKQWDKRFGGTGGEEYTSIASTTDGGYILGGISSSGISGDKTQPKWDTFPNQFDYWMVKIDSLGNKQWDKRFGGVGDDEYFGNISQTCDGGYLLPGTSYSAISGDKTEANLGMEQTWVVKTDIQGNKQWDKTLRTDIGNNDDERGWAIQTRDGCYVMANWTRGGIGGDKSQSNWDSTNQTIDYWIIKFCDSTLLSCVQSCNLSPVSLLANQVTFCSTDSTQICVPNNFPSYHWNNGSTNPCITTNLAGNYYVTVTDANGCTAESNHLAITVLPLPPVSISVNGDTLTVNNAVNQQWYLNGSAINGATTDMYIATQGGSYTVIVTDSNGCTATSSPVIISGIENVTEEDVVSVYPNPLSAGSCWLLVGNNFIGGTAEVTDADGRTVFKSEIRNPKSAISFEAAKGVYLLRISSSKGSTVRKLVRL